MKNEPSMHEFDEPSPRMKLRWRMLWWVCLVGPVAYLFFVDGDTVAAAVWMAMGLAAYGGFRAGAVSLLAMFAGVTVAILFAPALGMSQAARFTQWFGTTGLANRFLSIGVIGLLISLIVSSLLVHLGGRLTRSNSRIETGNRWLGFGFGVVEGGLAMLLFLGGMLIIEPAERKRAKLRDPNDTRGQLVSKFILTTADKTRASRLGPAIVTYNPFIRIPRLNKIDEVQQSVQVLSDPAKVKEILRHPSILQLQRRPEVREAIERLTEDPEIQEFLQSGKPMDGAFAMKLLNHPALMELLDQPGFMEEASEVIQNTNLLRSVQ